MQLHPDGQAKCHFKMKATENYHVQCSMINMTYVIQPMLPDNIYLLHEESVNIISSREKIYVKKEKCVCAHTSMLQGNL